MIKQLANTSIVLADSPEKEGCHCAGQVRRPTQCMTAPQEAGEILDSLRDSGAAASAAQIAAAHRLAAALEAAEGRFSAAAGDLAFNAVQRTDFDVGRLLAAVEERQEVYDEVAGQWTEDGRHGAPLPQVRLLPW